MLIIEQEIDVEEAEEILADDIDDEEKVIVYNLYNSDRNYAASIKNVLNSSTGIIQEFEIASKLDIKKIGMKYHKEFDKNYQKISKSA